MHQFGKIYGQISDINVRQQGIVVVDVNRNPGDRPSGWHVRAVNRDTGAIGCQDMASRGRPTVKGRAGFT